MKAIGYVRVSTDEQAKEGISLKHQEAKIMAYAVLHDIELVEIVRDEGMSAKTITTRSKALKAISRAKGGEVHAVIVYKLDRLFRNAAEALTISQELAKAGAALHSVTEHIDTQSAMGKFFFTIMAACAEMERNLISERTRDALRHKKASGEVYNHAPYGWDVVEGRLVPNKDEQEEIENIKRQRSAGLSLQAIADYLNEQEIPAKKGGKWAPTQVKNVLEFKGPEA